MMEKMIESKEEWKLKESDDEDTMRTTSQTIEGDQRTPSMSIAESPDFRISSDSFSSVKGFSLKISVVDGILRKDSFWLIDKNQCIDCSSDNSTWQNSEPDRSAYIGWIDFFKDTWLNNIVIPDKSVSKEHGVVLYRDEEYFMVSISKKPIWVLMTNEFILWPGMTIDFGV